MSRASIITSIRHIAERLGLVEGEDFTFYPSEVEGLVEVGGSSWKTSPMGSITRAAEMFSEYLYDPETGKSREGFEFTDADRSGVYFSKGGCTVRFM